MDAGEPGWKDRMPEANPDLLGHIYAGPYAIAAPELATIVVDSMGVAGYILATADSEAFREWEEQQWWPSLRAQYPRMSGSSWNAQMISALHDPPHSPSSIVKNYPAHLHIDLLPRAQGLGIGRKLMEGLQQSLREMGVEGLHLGVGKTNLNAIAFYTHLGFAITEEAPDSLFMAISL
jgi:ribosomal protein S18 acetylase RimI-like enzyme